MPEKPTAIDLFAGAGGLSCGFKQAGYEITLAVEQDKWACETLRFNHPGTIVIEDDISNIASSDIQAQIPKKPDVVIGGPPCQGFSVCLGNRYDPKDPRNSLFMEFLRVVRDLKPKMFLMENVTAVLKRKTAGGDDVIGIIKKEFGDAGYKTAVQLLNAVEYGVPQNRVRLFIFGSNKSYYFTKPPPTHAPGSDFGLKKYVTLWEAISDLPQIEAGESVEPDKYRCEPQNEYQAEMRRNSIGVYNHLAMKHTKRVIERFKQIGYGESVSDVYGELAPRKRASSGISSIRYDQNNRRMWPDKPCHTIPASFYANFIHPYLNRNFTAREGARIQSFPDDFIFKGKPTVVSHKLLAREQRLSEKHLCQYNQIGNAVPPLLAKVIGEALKKQLMKRST